jgi:hypothetical protein
MCLICIEYRLNIFKYILNVIQDTLVYIKCICTLQKVTKLQLNLQLNEHKGLFLYEKPKKLVNIEGCII